MRSSQTRADSPSSSRRWRSNSCERNSDGAPAFSSCMRSGGSALDRGADRAGAGGLAARSSATRPSEPRLAGTLEAPEEAAAGAPWNGAPSELAVVRAAGAANSPGLGVSRMVCSSGGSGRAGRAGALVIGTLSLWAVSRLASRLSGACAATAGSGCEGNEGAGIGASLRGGDVGARSAWLSSCATRSPPSSIISVTRLTETRPIATTARGICQEVHHERSTDRRAGMASRAAALNALSSSGGESSPAAPR